MTLPRSGPALALQLAALLGLSLACAVLAQRVLPHRVPWRQDWSHRVEAKAGEQGVAVIDLARARVLVDGGQHLALDARPHADYLRGHLPGAFSLPDADLQRHLPDVMPLLTPEQPLLVYCSGVSCDESLHLAELLRQQGFTNLVVFVGGFTAWQQAGLPVER